MTYASGQVDGTVYLDTVTIQGGDGDDDDGYTLPKHAFASVQSVQSEPLQIFDGVLGLAFPANSAILQKGKLTGGTAAAFATDDGGRATSFAAGLLAGDGDDDDVPDHSFLSLTLERPGSARIPSLLGIGKHPDKGTVTLPDSRGGKDAQLGDTNTHYTQVLSAAGGGQNLWWKLGISSMSVWADGQERPVALAREFSIGGEEPSGDGSVSAVLDTGSSWIVVNDQTAASFYGALGDDAGVEKGDDGLCKYIYLFYLFRSSFAQYRILVCCIPVTFLSPSLLLYDPVVGTRRARLQ
jgi:hypothetical protein